MAFSKLQVPKIAKIVTLLWCVAKFLQQALKESYSFQIGESVPQDWAIEEVEQSYVIYD